MKLFKSLIATLVAAAACSGFTACDGDLDMSPIITPLNPDQGEMDGSAELPLNVPATIAYYNAYYSDAPDAGTYYWITGYIVGDVATTETVFVANDETSEFAAPFNTPNNILLAADPAETDYNNCIAIQLPSGNVRSSLNLKDNPANKGLQVTLHGYIDKYLGLPGVRSVDSFNWGAEGIPGLEPVFFRQVSEITSGKAYGLIAHDGSSYFMAKPADQGANYGWLYTNKVTPTDGVVKGDEVNAFVFTAVSDGNYYISDAYGRFLYMSGTFNSFQLSNTLNTSDNSFLWTPTLNSDGTWTIVNVGMVKTIQYFAEKNSFGAYTTIESGYYLPILFEMNGDPKPFDPVNPDPVTPPAGEGDGTVESPFSVAQALAYIASGFEGEAVVKGIVSVVSDLSPSYGNATYTIKDNLSDANGLIVYRGYYLNGDKFTSEDQLKVGMNVVVSGSLVNYAGNTPEFTSGSKIISIDGQGGGSGDDPVTPPAGDGDGTENNPFACSQVIALNPTSTTAVAPGGSQIWVEGYIVGYIPTGGSSTVLSGTVFAADANAANTNMVIAPTADCTDYNLCVGVQLPTETAAPGVRSALNLKDNPGVLGKHIKIFGDVMKYCGGPGLKNTSKYIFYDGGGNVNPDPDPDPVTPPVGDGNGTLESPYSVAQALAAIQGGFEGEAVVKGIISVVTEVSTSYGNATYTIKDNLSDAKGLIVYRGYYLNGDKFTSADQLKVGMSVVVSGSLVNYAGNTPEFTTGSKIVTIDAN